MDRHISKTHFPVIGLTVIALEILAFLIFLSGVCLALFNMVTSYPIFTPMGVMVLVLGVLTSSFIILAFGEFLQLLLKIEVNTRVEMTPVVTKVPTPIVKSSPVKRKK